MFGDVGTNGVLLRVGGKSCQRFLRIGGRSEDIGVCRYIGGGGICSLKRGLGCAVHEKDSERHWDCLNLRLDLRRPCTRRGSRSVRRARCKSALAVMLPPRQPYTHIGLVDQDRKPSEGTF